MTDKTEVEKSQESYDRRLKELEMQHHREMEILTVHNREIHSVRDDQKKELLAQNDGLLGAVGRLHAENEALKKRVAELEPALAKAKEDVLRAHKDSEGHMHFAEERVRNIIEETKREAQREIERLKEKLVQAQNRKKKA